MVDDMPEEYVEEEAVIEEVEEKQPETPALILSDKQYDVLKFVALILLPALGTLYFAVAQIWGLPKATEVVGTIAAIDTFLGLILNRSAKAYNESDAQYDGEIVVADDVDEYANKKKVVMKVKVQPRDQMPPE